MTISRLVKIEQAIRNRAKKLNTKHVGVSKLLYWELSKDLPNDYYVFTRNIELLPEFIRVYNREDY